MTGSGLAKRPARRRAPSSHPPCLSTAGVAQRPSRASSIPIPPARSMRSSAAMAGHSAWGGGRAPRWCAGRRHGRAAPTTAPRTGRQGGGSRGSAGGALSLERLPAVPERRRAGQRNSRKIGLSGGYGWVWTEAMASPAGFEPTAPGLGILCSIRLSYGDSGLHRLPSIPSAGWLFRLHVHDAIDPLGLRRRA
jgi:hypothetical protein